MYNSFNLNIVKCLERGFLYKHMGRKVLVIVILLTALLVSGCKKNTEVPGGNDLSENSAEDLNESDTTEEINNIDEEDDSMSNADQNLPKPATNYVTETMQDNAVLAEGNLTRLAAVMRKARAGEPITVGVIGGSITQGSSATNEKNSYAYLFYQWWVNAFPDTEVNYVNAGIGATNSYLAVHRVDNDLLAHKPDVVVVEFSVNDSNTTFFRNTYEDLVRKILKADNDPAVIQLFMTMEDGTSAQTQHLYVGFNYDLPRISYREAVLKEMEEGRLAWKEISPDNIHPNDKGHAIVGELLWNFLNSVYLRMDSLAGEPEYVLKAPLSSEAYENSFILDSESIEPRQMGSFKKGNIFYRFNNNWYTDSGDESIIFEVTARNIGIMYYKTTDGTGGQYEVYIDGEYSSTLDADFTGGWGNYAESTEVYSSMETAVHTIEIRKSAGSTGDFFAVLGLLISQ